MPSFFHQWHGHASRRSQWVPIIFPEIKTIVRAFVSMCIFRDLSQGKYSWKAKPERPWQYGFDLSLIIGNSLVSVCFYEFPRKHILSCYLCDINISRLVPRKKRRFSFSDFDSLRGYSDCLSRRFTEFGIGIRWYSVFQVEKRNPWLNIFFLQQYSPRVVSMYLLFIIKQTIYGYH